MTIKYSLLNNIRPDEDFYICATAGDVPSTDDVRVIHLADSCAAVNLQSTVIAASEIYRLLKLADEGHEALGRAEAAEAKLSSHEQLLASHEQLLREHKNAVEQFIRVEAERDTAVNRAEAAEAKLSSRDGAEGGTAAGEWGEVEKVLMAINTDNDWWLHLERLHQVGDWRARFDGPGTNEVEKPSFGATAQEAICAAGIKAGLLPSPADKPKDKTLLEELESIASANFADHMVAMIMHRKLTDIVAAEKAKQKPPI